MQHLSGKFIALDGPEGSGKSTQAKLLVEALLKTGLDVLSVRDPGTSVIGEKIRAILLDTAHTEMAMRCEMLLYMAARAQMMAQTIRPALAAGKVVLSDRFISSTLAYQLDGDGLTAAEIKAVGDVAVNRRWPDLTIIFNIPADKSMARVLRAKDRIEQRPMEYHAQVYQNYLKQAQGDPKYRVIDADRPVQVVHAALLAILKEM